MDPAIETASVMDVELWNRHDVVSAIEGRLEALAGSGIIRCDEVSMWSVEKRVEVDHVARHVIGPFEDLGSDVDQECIRGPTSKDGFESPEYRAGVSEQFFDKIVTDVDSFSIENSGAEPRLLGDVSLGDVSLTFALRARLLSLFSGRIYFLGDLSLGDVSLRDVSLGDVLGDVSLEGVSLGDVSLGDVLHVGLTLSSSVSCWSWVFALCSGRTHDILGLLLELGIGPLLW
jgi:hypothetical protein